MIIFIAALILRILFIFTYPRYNLLASRIYTGDGPSYDGYALSIMEGRGYVYQNLVARRPPLYPVFLAGVYSLFGHSPVSVRFLQAMLGALSCLLVYLIGKEAFGFWVGIVSGSIMTFYYPQIQLCGYVMPEPLYIVLVLTSLWFLIRFYNQRFPLYLLASGLFMGLSALTREISLALTGSVALWLCIYEEKGRKVLSPLIFILASVMIIVPWTWRNYLHFGKFVPLTVSAGHTLYLGNNPTATGGKGGDWKLGEDSSFPSDVDSLFTLQTDEELKARAWGYIRNNPGRFFQLSFKKFINMWRPFYSNSSSVSKGVSFLSYIPIMAFAIWGIYLTLPQWRLSLLFYLFIFTFVIVHMLTISTIRYRYPAMPMLVLLAGVGIVRTWERLKGSRYG